MPNRTEGLDEAVEAGLRAFKAPGFRSSMERDHVEQIVRFAAPAIRNQERQRIREALTPLLDRFREAQAEFIDGKAGSGSALNRIEGEIATCLEDSDV